MHNKRGPKKPRFPRKQWVAGQAPRVEKPKKGRGSYDRRGEKREVSGEVEDLPAANERGNGKPV